MNQIKRILGVLPILFALASCSTFDRDAALVRADTRFEDGDFEAAIADYTRVLRDDPENVRAYNNRGVARLRTDNAKGAIADFDAALQRQPAFAEALCNRGLARFQTGEIDGAISDYSAALSHSSRYAKAWAARGIARSMKGDLEGAASDFKAALDVAPAEWPDRKAVEAELAKITKVKDGK